MTMVIHKLTALETLEAAASCQSLSNAGKHPDAILEKVAETLRQNLIAQVPVGEIDEAAKIAGWSGTIHE